ncbi:uncharacterized protein LOC144640900 isoform X2 [Oculina patagonica]
MIVAQLRQEVSRNQIIIMAARDQDFVEDFSTDDEAGEENEDPNQLWEVEDVLDLRGEEDTQEVLVRWKNYSSEFDSWIDLRSNPELRSFLERNQANPDSSSLARHLVPAYDPNDEHRLSIRQAIFDELGAQRATPNADRGRARRSYVKLPFPKAAFLRCFGEGKFNFDIREADGTGRQNVKFQATRGELDPVLGVGWGSRSFSTSTVCEVDPTHPVGIKWSYKTRVDFDHSACPRCMWRGENDRPTLCSPQKIMIPGPPWLELSFCKRRFNRLQVV